MKIKSAINRPSSASRLPRPSRRLHSMFDVGCSMFDVPHSRSAASRRSERGMALVITLIMLSVTLVMAVAFLALAKRERGSVTTAAETTTARLAADSALSAAQAQIAANLLTAPAAAGNFGLLVSTNYYNSYGFVPGISNPTNVNYFDNNGNLLTGDNLIQNIANLYLSPRAPVFIVTNQATGSNDFRFYLDLNENGRFDANGWVAERDNTGQTNGNYLLETGDPEWIGVLARPDQPHSADNPFVARYAFFAQPIGNSLDLNYIHNDARRTSGGADDGFLRNQGVGSWELNFGAFLADLNTNQWFTNSGGASYYDYEPTYISGPISQNRAFDDALALLNYRYGGNYNFLPSANNSLTNVFNYPYNIDGYSDGPLQTTLNTNASSLGDVLSHPWSGANNADRFFSLPSDLFDPTKTAMGVSPVAVAAGNYFAGRLMNAGNSPATYDRYTFYRMLAQLGTDSSPDDGKLNLNYRNVTNGAVVVGMETNLYPWTALEFFTNAADRMLKLYTTNWFQSSPSNYLITYYNTNFYYYNTNIAPDPTGYGLTNVPFYGMTNQVPAFGLANIPVQVNSNFVYAPAVNRLLQLAANLYDASTTNFFPSVFRPTFWITNQSGNKIVYINGYTDVSRYSRFGGTMTAGTPPLDIPTNVTDLPYGFVGGLLTDPNCNVYGVPWIIGAKKNLPGFNQLSLINAAQVTRKLMVSRSSTDPATATYWTNQLYVMGISNNLGISFWNSYNTNYPRPVTVYASDNLSVTMTNGAYTRSGTANFVIPSTNISYWSGSQWQGTLPNATPTNAAFFTANWATNFLTEAVYNFNPPGFNPVGSVAGASWGIPPTSLAQLPQFWLAMTNCLQAFVLDGNNVIDYVQLRDPITITNLNGPLADPIYPDETGTYYQWSTNAYQASSVFMTYGVFNQLYVSQHTTLAPTTGGKWSTAPTAMGLTTPPAEAAFFSGFFVPSFQYGGLTYTNSLYAHQAPYTPTRTVYSSFLLQANDPLVHYLASDLNSQYGAAAIWAQKLKYYNGVWQKSDDSVVEQLPQPPSDPLGGRYQPWGVTKQMATLSGVVSDAYSPTYKDPQVWGPDYWDFPTNQYPTVGWIGRVHRGTPWQTVDLKATNVLRYLPTGVGPKTWANWIGDIQTSYGQYFDAINSAPVQDRLLFDLFTTRFNDNAVRGALSVNQTNLASWSALLSGMVVLSNNAVSSKKTTAIYTNMIIDPAGVDYMNSALWNIVTNINSTRTNFVNADGVTGVFEHAGDILTVPMLTGNSPFLNWNNAFQQQLGISDEVYEWLPQQMMGLVRCSTSPRYVVYCYGQTLKPAPNGLVTGGPSFGLCTNYQVTAESVVRAVVRVDPHVTPTGTNYSAVVESYNVVPSN
jgi:hypothetical protein